MVGRTRKLLFGAAAVALGSMATLEEAAAQQAQAAAGGLEEIVVTARRREESIQSVPIAITAFSAETIREKQIQTNADIAKLVPGYSVRETTRGYTAGPGSQQAFLRSLPGVRTYFAEVPAPITGAGNFYDLQNIQALTGPQGTLFGLNATGGAILVEPKKPVNQYQGYVSAILGNRSWRQIEGALNIPVVDDKILVRLAARREIRDGFTEIVSTGERIDNDDNWAWRAAVTIRPTETVENYFVYSGYFVDQLQQSQILQGFNPRGTPTFIVGTAALQSALARQQELGPRRVQATNLMSNNQERRLFLIDVLKWEINDNLTFKNIAGYRRYGGQTHYDADGTSLRLFSVGSDQTTPIQRFNGVLPSGNAGTGFARNYTEEAQLQGNFLDGNLTWVAGGFLQYSDIEKADIQPGQCADVVGLFQCGGASLSDPKGRTQSLFAQATLDVGKYAASLDGLKLTGGFRYNWDWQSTWSYGVAANGTTCTSAFADRNCIQQLAGKFKAPSWTLAVDYQVTPDTLVYVTNRRGYSSGVFNPSAPTVDLQNTDPEYNTDVELGLKADWTLGGVRARTNVAGFYQWYDNVQKVSSLNFVNAAGQRQTIALNLNAAKAKIYGLEAQFTARLTEALELSGYYQFLKAKYQQFKSVDSAGNPVDLSNQPFGDTPKHRISITGKLYLPIDEAYGEASLQATYTYRDKVFVEAGYGTPFDHRPGYGLLDLRADWNNVLGSSFDISAFMTNATNKLYTLGNFPVWNSLGFHAEIFAAPRSYALQLRYRFNQ